MPSPSAVVPGVGIQALILCGPGVSLNTFTTNEEYPKALIPLANRPLIYYQLSWLKKSGITDITLITPPSTAAPLQAALQQNPHLTSLPSPSPSVLAPKDLDLNMGTAELLRLPEVQACIKTDFLLLPCDLVCEIPGESLLEAWMVSQSALGGSSTVSEGRNAHGPTSSGSGGEKGGRRGGLTVFYQTQNREESVKGEGTDFVAIAPLDNDEAPAVSHAVDGPAALRHNLSKVVLSMPMATVKEKMEQDKGLLLRHSLTEKHPRVKMLSTFRDAHLYIFPYWVKELALRQETFQSVSEDLVGFWAKAEWQRGLGEKLGMDEIFHRENGAHAESGSYDGESIEEEIDLLAMSTTSSRPNISATRPTPTSSFASRVSNVSSDAEKPELKIPPLLAYVQRGSAPFVRRVDSSAILLSTALRLAKLESIEEAGAAASPFALPQKIAHPEGIAQRTTITKSDCLVGQNTTVESKCVIKESVIGANVKICSGARLQRCLIMDGAVVNSSCTLTGCIVGRRAVIGKDSVLKDSEVGDGYLVEEETDAKNEKFMIFEGLEDDEDMGSSGDFDGEDELGF
ncbi:uncharacterized protein N7496_012084 [Penicillium cataractarum]|uniref:Translation initiation factor eIF2B subunit gamma n=1 Tax=Penicillium cataractarum TaxID=2100454 RepID=A0A9W9RGF7_9EURO|nr:uncharacterized protein N7496_012084 [Penicillium cataractarum]KAJ5359671.1 hypothetical protein N7496_012084 [Penicillium cataractarum]